MKSFYSNEFLKFLITGGVAALINFFSRILFSQWFDFSFAICLAYFVGMATAFVLAKMFVFKQSHQDLLKSSSFFVLVNLFALLQTWGVSLLFMNILLPYFGISSMTQEIAHAVGITVPVFTSYLGHKYLSFR